MNIKGMLLCMAAVLTMSPARAELPPAEKPVARVLASQIYAKDIEPDSKTVKDLKKSVPQEKLSAVLAEYRRKRLNELIWQPLKKQFMEELAIRVSDKDLDDFANAMIAKGKEAKTAYEKNIQEWEDELKKEGLTPEKKAELERRIRGLKVFLSEGKEKQLRTYREIGRQVVETWKVNQALYSIYGGEAVSQQSGPEPFGAYRAFLMSEEKKGNFEIYQKELRDEFWEYYFRKQPFQIPKDKIDFETPWWLITNPQKTVNTNGKK